MAALVALMLVLVTGGGACRKASTPAPPESGTVDIKLGNKTFRLEVAATERARRYGLMNRESMPADRGMVFVFRDDQGTGQGSGFWMRNTLIPLDLIYIDADGRVVSIKQGKPLDETPIASDGPYRYTIELNAGAAAGAGLKAGDRVDIPSEVRAPGNLE